MNQINKIAMYTIPILIFCTIPVTLIIFSVLSPKRRNGVTSDIEKLIKAWRNNKPPNPD